MIQERIPSGIAELDKLIEEGLLRNTINAVFGGTGTGKTTFAIQFALSGLYDGDHALYITFEQSPEKIIRQAESLGLPELRTFYEDEKIIFHHATGEEVVDFLTTSLLTTVDDLKDVISIHSRVVIDPLTPVLWELGEKKTQRIVLTRAFATLQELGTILTVVEEPKGFETGEKTVETETALFLSDAIFQLQFLGLGGLFNRTLRILKFRGTKHGEDVYPFVFTRGNGITLFLPEMEKLPISEKRVLQFSKIFDEYMNKVVKKPASNIRDMIIKRIVTMKEQWTYKESPESLLEEIIKIL
ncbi:MAG: RAD55 family ATPase [Candidatus Heimdallarchaeota archaeon]